MTDTFGWGILAPGRIAADFATDLRLVPGGRLAAVGSRSLERAAAFAEQYGDDATRAHGSAEEMLADDSVDVVYVASPHTLHLEQGLAALAAGKPVLVEKPVTVNAREAEALFAAARARELFCMEAMWTACHPVILALRKALLSGDLGVPRQVHADLGFLVDRPPTDRLLDPATAGGALLDMGIYPLTFAHLMLGEAERLTATAYVDSTGIDRDVAISTLHPGGAVGALTASTTAWSPRTATIATTTGLVEVPPSLHHPRHATFTPRGAEPRRIDGAAPVIGSGLGNEILHVQECLAAGLVESPLVPHAQSLTLMRQMDALRTQIGVRYAADLA